MVNHERHSFSRVNPGGLCIALTLAVFGLHEPRPGQRTGATGDWSWLSIGHRVGSPGIEVSDVDGTPEIILGAGALYWDKECRYWLILRYNPVTLDYEQVFSSEINEESAGIRAIAVGELLASRPGNEIAIGRKDGVVEIWNQKARSLELTFQTFAVDMNDLILGDVDLDQGTDLILVAQTNLYAYDVQGQWKWTVPSVGGDSAAVGQMDGDPSLEIATTDGNVVDALSSQVQWKWRDGFGVDVAAADIDGDGLDEVIFSASNHFLTSMDVDTALPKWSIPTGGSGPIAVGNIDGDQALEVVVGEFVVEAFDTVTQAQDLSMRASDRLSHIAFGDVDEDGETEILWGQGHRSSSLGVLAVVDVATETIEWESLKTTGPFLGPLYGDLDGDGTKEIVAVAAASRSSSTDNWILVFDGTTLALRAVSPLIRDGVTSMVLANMDSDPAMEIVTAGRDLEIYDFAADGTFTSIWRVRSVGSDDFRTVTVANLDEDPALELIAGSEEFLFVYEPPGEDWLWRSFFVSETKDLRIANSDSDPGLEIHALSKNGNIYIFDGAKLEAEAILFPKTDHYTSMHMVELYPGTHAIASGNEGGEVSAWLYTGGGDYGYMELGPFKLTDTPIDGIQIVPYSPWLLVGSGGIVTLYAGLTPAWSTISYGEGFGRTMLLLPHFAGFITGGPDGLAGFIPR